MYVGAQPHYRITQYKRKATVIRTYYIHFDCGALASADRAIAASKTTASSIYQYIRTETKAASGCVQLSDTLLNCCPTQPAAVAAVAGSL